jgi:hypothetical protein
MQAHATFIQTANQATIVSIQARARAATLARTQAESLTAAQLCWSLSNAAGADGHRRLLSGARTEVKPPRAARAAKPAFFALLPCYTTKAPFVLHTAVMSCGLSRAACALDGSLWPTAACTKQ